MKRDITITNTCRATGTSSDRRGCRDVFTREFLIPRAIRRETSPREEINSPIQQQ